ncbi:hypothetical protein ACFTAO_10170 [Paenibacillus rhizoplanae]
MLEGVIQEAEALGGLLLAALKQGGKQLLLFIERDRRLPRALDHIIIMMHTE